MGRKFSDLDRQIFHKLAPETGGNADSGAGHEFPFILRPISHRFAEDADDFRERLDRLDPEEVSYLADLVLANQEEVMSLDDDDRDSFFDLVEEKVSPEKRKEIVRHLGIVDRR
ncbi:hypothetical protein MsAg5_02030 [Methanosarcinaceae archaeon Ag5]|uniref:Uncharacterized protein n=1 Tax=Methanolapillus africanus TaxID=3028297 RepID=A0AAE4MGV3_9EURY|nr:hypothetical protein [Methanosarcinaceae archaeon Ag5]